MHCAGKMDPGELMETVTFGCEKIFRSTDREITDAEMETIVQASLDGTAAEPDAPEDDSGAARLMDAKHKASDFNIEEEFVSITSLDGVELKKNEALSDISQTWQPSHSERARESTLVEVPSTFAFPGVKAKIKKNDLPILLSGLKENAPPAAPKAAKKERPTESECWVCHDGGDLLCCSYCPKVYHPECLREHVDERDVRFACPQHQCVVCDCAAREVGGVLFRCTECPLCFCYEHNPPESEILHEGCPAMAALNYQPSSVVWIKCASCVQHSLTGERRLDIDVWARQELEDYDDDEVQAVLDRKWNSHGGKNHGVLYLIKWMHYGPKRNCWRHRDAIDPKYHHILDQYDVTWREEVDAKEKRVQELQAARLGHKPRPWEAPTKEERAARRLENKRKRAEALTEAAAAAPANKRSARLQRTSS